MNNQPANSDKARDALWDIVWTLNYKSLYALDVAKFMVRKWTIFDLVTRLLLALFATSSAISGWAAWKTDAGKIFWAIASGLTAFASIVDGVISSQEKIKRYTQSMGGLTRLTQALQSLMDQMRINPEFDLQKTTGDFDKQHQAYVDIVQAYPVDVFLTRNSENEIQEALDKYINK